MQDSSSNKQRRHHHHHHQHQHHRGQDQSSSNQRQNQQSQMLSQSQSHFQFDRLDQDFDAVNSATVVLTPTVRKKCPSTSASTSCKLNTTAANASGGASVSSVAISTKSADKCHWHSDIYLHGISQPNKVNYSRQPQLQQQEERQSRPTTDEDSDCIALRRSFSQITQGSRPNSCAKLRSYSQSQSQSQSQSTRNSSSFTGAADAAAADPFAYQDRYPYSNTSHNSEAANIKRMSAANNSRRSSRIKLPSTRAESRDEGNYFYPADSLKLYGHAQQQVANCELDDESDSGASSLPSSNGSTLNSSCASIDLVRCDRAAFEASSGSPQHRRISVSESDQLANPAAVPSHQPAPHHQQQHPQQHQQPHLAEFSKFKNDSGTFTDSEISPEYRGCTPDKVPNARRNPDTPHQDATPTKQQLDQDSPDAPADLSDSSSIKSRSTLNSVVTVIERARRDSQEDDGADSPRFRLRRSPQNKPKQKQKQQQQLQSSGDRSSSSTLDGDEDVPSSPTSPDEAGAAATSASSTGDFDDGDGAASEASDLTSVSAAGAADFSLIRSQLQYDFNTWDRPAIRTFGIRVREIQRPPSETVIADWSDEELLARVRQLSRLRGAAARLNPATRQFAGRIRVHINLIRPIRLGRAELPQLVPRGQSRLLQLTSSVRSQEVIQVLLNTLQVKEQAYKFALYEHCIEGDKSVTFRRLHPTESPLAVVLSWLHGIPTAPDASAIDEANSVFERKKIVLQENESGLVNWSAFSVPELSNFLHILQREESEYRESIQLKYLLVKREMRRRLRQLDKQKQALEEDWP